MAIEQVGSVSANNQKPMENKAAVVVARSERAKPAPVQSAESVQNAQVLQRAASEPSLAQVTQAVQDINKSIQSLTQGVEFSIDTSSKKTVIKIVDVQTGDVLRQIPSAEAMEIAKALDRVMGNLIRDQA